MNKYYKYDTGGRYLLYACGFGYFADVQTIVQAEGAARRWWALTADCDAIFIRERDGGTVKTMRREAEEGETEVTDKEKIIEIIAPYVSSYGDDEAIANAIIAAGFRREK